MNRSRDKKSLEQEEEAVDEVKELLDKINATQADLINQMQAELIFLRNQNQQLLNKLLLANKAKEYEMKPTDIPIGGYTPLRQRISDAEAESLRKSIEELERTPDAS